MTPEQIIKEISKLSEIERIVFFDLFRNLSREIDFCMVCGKNEPCYCDPGYDE